MKQLKTQCFFILFILHQSLCQQSSQQYGQQPSQQYTQPQTQPQSQYSQPSQYTPAPQQGKVQLEDIERDNLKSSQTPTTTAQQQQQQQQVQVQPQQQYIAYPQDQLFYIQPQQAAALFQTPQQSVPSIYGAQPSTGGLVSPQQQQFYVQPYYTQQAAPQSYPFVDFSQFQLYPSALPYTLPQTASHTGQVNQVVPNVVSDYFKSAAAAAVQPSPAQLKTPQLPQVQGSVKTAQTTQVPALNNYLLGNTLPNTYYQPVQFASQPQNPQYYSYNSFYQVPNPAVAAKSVFSSGIKSTTPSIPTKLKDESFVPVNNGNYRYDFATAEQNNYNKLRSG